VTQIENNKKPRLQKLQSMFKIKEIVKNANKAIAELLKDKDLNVTEINNLIYAAAMVITEGNRQDATNQKLTIHNTPVG